MENEESTKQNCVTCLYGALSTSGEPCKNCYNGKIFAKWVDRRARELDYIVGVGLYEKTQTS